MDKKSWIALGATSALGLGVLASGAISVANAMPLYDMSQATEVPPISTVTVDGKAFTGTGDVRFWVVQSTASSTTPSTASPAAPTPTPVSPASAAPAPTVQQAPAPQPQPVAPAPVSGDSADSADSVDSVDD